MRPLTEADLSGYDITDRPKPDLPRQPPLEALAKKPRGVALNAALNLIFLVQSRPRILGKDALLKVPIESGDDSHFGLIDLMVVPAVHRGRPGSHAAGSVVSNRKRQLRQAFSTLAATDLKMVHLPPGGRGKPRFDQIHLNRETGAYGVEPPRYTIPKSSVKGLISIPSAFFLNGWIHALTNREIAMWLMLRDLDVRNSTSTAIVGDPHELHIEGRQRLLEYDLSRAAWDSHARLEAFGLIQVDKDPNRRLNGTTIDGKYAAPHKFRLFDAGLNVPAVERVLDVLELEAKTRDNGATA
ncbi:hypothetical protein A5687_19140 [Mycobacterium mantenii]|uniref:hypothetical protein n=1 Tax=Mycobacterium mantenii TaxID=560555 RepID=UPI0007FF6D8D|nr:hypothetical protein [Mycobacterium mantenii]OBH60566.1 hypothetical protein A5687_19140 [Mycobacterium mantenii]